MRKNRNSTQLLEIVVTRGSLLGIAVTAVMLAEFPIIIIVSVSLDKLGTSLIGLENS